MKVFHDADHLIRIQAGRFLRFEGVLMRIFNEPMDQCLLCLGYDFHHDNPIFREAKLKCYQPGVKQKEHWRYRHNQMGLCTLVAYEGSQPIGHIEFIPIQHAPRPVIGEQILFINCLVVAKHARCLGVGRALLEIAEKKATEQGMGIAVVASSDHAHMPARFFASCGYRPGEIRGKQQLFYKSGYTQQKPRFLPLRYQPQIKPGILSIDYFHCPQCPYSGWALRKFRQSLSSNRKHIELNVINTGERSAIERWGIAQGAFIDGHPVVNFLPQRLKSLRHEVRVALDMEKPEWDLVRSQVEAERITDSVGVS
jgi:GNAT superfamily N-acetyltransferase